MNFIVRTILSQDVEALAATFTSWNKNRDWFEKYFEQHQRGDRVTFVALKYGKAVGYGNVLWKSEYQPFLENKVPEINDLGVIDEYQNCGIGRAIIYQAELMVFKAKMSTIGIGVGQTTDYTAARHLYSKLGYEPDGRGICPTQYGDVVFLTKKLNLELFN